MKVTMFAGSEKNVSSGFVQDVTFEEFASMFEECHQGDKHDGYFVRGELNPLHRKDINLHDSCLLILDGDSSIDDHNSAPSPSELHQILVEWNINHFIYTSHSHTADRNKFRCVIECDLPSKEYLKPTAEKIISELNAAGYPLAYVKEMGVWSQPWFIPRRDNPEDGLYEYYRYTDGQSYEAFDGDHEQARKKSVSVNHTGYADRLREIRTGENFHDNLVALSWGYFQDGMARGNIISTLQEIMQGCEVHDSRWQERYDEIERVVDGAIARGKKNGNGSGNIEHGYDSEIEYIESDVEIPDLPAPVIEGKIPIPPGLMGELVKSAYDMQRFQYEEVALVSALGLVAGITARKFNVSDTGLNVYLTLIMGTGMGKDSISEFIEYAFTNLHYNDVSSQPLSFMGPGRFTGPKGVIKSLKSSRSQVCVFTEAGLLLRSSAGDMDGLTRSLLSLYSCSGKGRITKKEVFSKEDDNIDQLTSPALSIINEATPETLLRAFRQNNSIDVGDLPRQSIFRILRDMPTANRNTKKNISAKCEEKLKALITLCSEIQADDRPDVVDLIYHKEIEEDIWSHSDKWVKTRNDNYHTDNVKANMASRMHLKALKFSALATVFNRNDNVIHKAEWEWAKSLIQYEYDGIDNFFANSGGLQKFEGAVYLVAKAITNVLNNKFTDAKKSMDARYRKAGIVSRYCLRQILKNNSKIAEYDSEKFGKIQTGLDTILNYMIEQGYLYPVEYDPFANKKELFKVTDMFSLLSY